MCHRRQRGEERRGHAAPQQRGRDREQQRRVGGEDDLSVRSARFFFFYIADQARYLLALASLGAPLASAQRSTSRWPPQAA